jgi:alkyl hydroperoxide reductase subunit AhpC
MDMIESFDDFDYCPPMVGQQAPDFSGTAYSKAFEGGFGEVSLSDYEGKWLVLFFFPAAFTGPCNSEVRAFGERHGEFQAIGAELLGVSGDTKFTLEKLVASGEVGEPPYPLLSDSNHHIGVDYRTYVDEAGVNFRGLFIIDPEGTLRYQVVHEPFVARSTDETLRVLKALQTGEICLVDWKP